MGGLGRPRWFGRAADLLPLLAVEGEGDLVTTTGRVGLVLACSGLNLDIPSDETAEALAGHFADALGFLPGDAQLQLLVINEPLTAEEWLPGHLAPYLEPGPAGHHLPGLDPYRASLEGAYTRELGARHIPRLRYYAILTLPGGPAPARRRGFPARTLVRERAAHQRQREELERVATELRHALADMGVYSERLDRARVLALVWSCLNPRHSGVTPPPDPGSDPELPGLRELLAQSTVERRREVLRLEGGYESTLALRMLPDQTWSGWLKTLVASDLSFRFAMHIEPIPKSRESRRLKQSLRLRHAAVAERQAKGLAPDIDEVRRHEEVAEMLDAMATSNERTHHCAVYVTARAASREGLATGVQRVIKAFRDTAGTAVDRCQWVQDLVWPATLPCGVDSGRRAARVAGRLRFRSDTRGLGHSFPFLHHRAGTQGGELLGFSSPGREAVTLNMYDGNLENGNQIVTGMGGTGKTMLAQVRALHHLARGGRVIVFDRSTTPAGESHWSALAALAGGAVHRLGLDSEYRINPWDLPRGQGQPTRGKLEFLLGLHDVILERVLPHERALLEEGIRAVYAGPRRREGALQGWLRKEWGLADDPGRKQLCASLADRLLPFVHNGTYAPLVDGVTEVRVDTPLEIFNFKGLSDRLVPLVMLPLLERVWTIIADRSRPTLVVMDETWALLEHEASAPFVAELVRTGRHHGIWSLVMTQFVTDFLKPVGRAVLDNAAVALILAQAPSMLDPLQQAFSLTAEERRIVSRLRTDKGRKAGAFLHSRGGAESGAVDLFVTPEEYWLTTSYPPEAQARAEAIAAAGGEVWRAVRGLAAGEQRRVRPPLQLLTGD